MKIRHKIIIMTVILMVAGGIFYAISRRNDEPAASTNQKQYSSAQESTEAKQVSFQFSELQSNYPAQPDACLATDDSAELQIDSTEEDEITMAVITTIFDIPAGTNVDVYFKTQEDGVVTGTSVYESTYGSYNFTAQKAKTNDSANESWIVSKFEACQRT